MTTSKAIIGYSIDDTIFSFFPELINYYNKTYHPVEKISIEYLAKEKPLDTIVNAFDECINKYLDIGLKGLIFQFYYSEKFSNLRIIPGALDTITGLSKYEYYLISRRPKEIKKITLDQFKKNNMIIPEERIILTNEYKRTNHSEELSKIELAKNLGINIFFENDYYQAKAIATEIPILSSIFLERPHNIMQAKLDKNKPPNMHIIPLKSNDYENYEMQFAEAKETAIKIIRSKYE